VDTEECGCTDELETVTNKISSINIRNNNINHIDIKSKELLDNISSKRQVNTEPDYSRNNMYSNNSTYSCNSNQTPKKMGNYNNCYINTNNLFPHIINRASVVSSQTTHYSSNNKKNYFGDTSIEHFESEEK
jgi:hypothetical protein